MSDPILLSWANHVDVSGAVLTASASAGDLSISNVADPIVGRRHRLTSLTGWGQVDFLTNKTVGLLALVFPRDTTFPTSGTIRHQLDADGGTAGAGAAYDSTAVAIGTVDGYGYHVHQLATPVSARYWRWTFNVTGVSYIDVGRAWAGETWSPTYNIAFGYADEWSDLSRISVAERSGAEYVDERPRQRVFAFGLEALSEAERDDIREMQRLAGISKQILLVKDPANWDTETVLGRLAASTPILHRDLSIFSKAFTIRESL